VYKKAISHYASLIAHHGGIAHVAQSAEHFLGKEEVTGSIPVMGFEKGH
jgi:hypothetical protein